jgi:hypothetical protein
VGRQRRVEPVLRQRLRLLRRFRGNGNGFTNQPLDVLTSRDGGEQLDPAPGHAGTNNTKSRNGFGRSGCTVRTDSRGVVYVFDFQFGFSPTTRPRDRSR